MFASPAPIAEAEEVVYETADSLPGHGRVIFVTALTRHESRGRQTRESHVFLPRENLHLHGIVFAPMGREEAGRSLAEAVRATHALFAEQVAKRSGEERSEEGPGLRYATRRLEEHPFHEFRLLGQFSDAMWEIQDWTVSSTLREALGLVTRYRADAAEAELFRRIFAAG